MICVEGPLYHHILVSLALCRYDFFFQELCFPSLGMVPEHLRNLPDEYSVHIKKNAIYQGFFFLNILASATEQFVLYATFEST